MINTIIFIIAIIFGLVILITDIVVITSYWELFPIVLMVSAFLYEAIAYILIYFIK